MQRAVQIQVAWVIALCTEAACRDAAPQHAATYQYRHLETTGITDEVCLKGQWQAVMFSDSSNRSTLTSLRNHDTPATGAVVVVVGALGKTLRHTPSGPSFAESEAYLAFELTSWRTLAATTSVEFSRCR